MYKLFLFSVLLIGLLVCTAQTVDQTQDRLSQPKPTSSLLEGTWKLVKTKWGDMKEHKVPRREIYKIFTKGHFFFIYIDGKQVSGAGGGRYTATDNSFTESLEYYSWDHSAAGTKQQFDFSIEGDQLHQTGFINNTDKYDNYVIDEYYERVEEGISTAKTNELLGVWEYASGNGNTSDYLKENGLRSRKIFTPNHWYLVFTEQESGKYHGTGFGKYELSNNQYTEHIEAFSFDSTAVGKRFTFTLEQTGGQLIQTGKIDTEQYPDFTVKEYYERIE